MTLGIIDVGTNSSHLLIGTFISRGKFKLLLKERQLTLLGSGGFEKKSLTRISMQRTLKVLSRYALLMTHHGVDHIEAVATSAVRESRNGSLFVNRVRRKLGIPLRIISGKEEARLIYLGVVGNMRTHRSCAVVSIGGGSAQVSIGRQRNVRYVVSLPLGATRLAEEFIRHDPPRMDEVDALRKFVQRSWRPVIRATQRYRWQHTLGCSSMISQLFKAAHSWTYNRLPEPKNQLSINHDLLYPFVEWLRSSTKKQRSHLQGLDPKREDSILPAGIVLLSWMEQCDINTIVYKAGSLREGLIINYRMTNIF